MNRSILVLLFIAITNLSKGQQPGIQISNSTDSNLIIVESWGVSFAKSENWIVTESTDSVITLMQTSGKSTGDIITVTHFTGDSITDTDAKFGWITYRYDKSKQVWMKTLQEEINLPSGTIAKPAAALATTIDGFPVFSGTGRWKTFIIPLSYTSYLRFNIRGSGEILPLVLMTGTLKRIFRD
jgi:hypothetical protein